jgi:acetyltransferase-like isoleucine patch superfamily enzyme
MLRDRGALIGENVFAYNLSTEENFAKLLNIEDDVVMAYGVRIILHDSSLNNKFGLPIKFGKVVIRKGAYIGARCTILPGVEIGQGAIIGAGSIVTKDIPQDSVAFGVPARIMGTTEELKTRFLDNMSRESNGSFFYLDLPPWRERRISMNGKDISGVYKRFLKNID